MAQPRILLTRIDDRFIYGQDVALWNEAVGSNLVLIVNDEIAADSCQCAPMRVAAPEGVWPTSGVWKIIQTRREIIVARWGRRVPTACRKDDHRRYSTSFVVSTDR